MNRIHFDQCSHTHQVGHIQIAIFGCRRPDTVGFICQSDMKRIPVRFGIDSHGLDPQFATSPNHANGDLSPIGHQHFVKHHSLLLRCLVGFNQKQRLTVFDQLSVLHEYFNDLAPYFRIKFVHQFHRFHDADHRLLIHLASILNIRGRIG